MGWVIANEFRYLKFIEAREAIAVILKKIVYAPMISIAGVRRIIDST